MDLLGAATSGYDELVPIQMATLGLLVLAAHLGGKLSERLGFSVATGQLLGGVLVGPWALQSLGLMPAGIPYERAVDSFRFFTFIFVSLVAFSIGEELHVDRLRHVGRSTLVISAIQTGLTFTLVTLGLTLLGDLPLLDALIIGSIGVATAPALTFVILNRLRIEGRLRNILGSVEILSDVVGIVIFSLLVQLAEGYGDETGLFESWAATRGSLGAVLRDLFLAHLIGAGVYLLLRVLVRRRGGAVLEGTHLPEDPGAGLLGHMLAEHPSPSAQIFVLVVAAVSLGVGVAHALHLPFVATAAFAGFLVANFHSRAIFDSLKIDNLAALINLAFFALLGSMVRFDVFDRSTALLVPIYVAMRALGKIGGTWIGCRVVGEDRKITSCLPTLLLPQAGVAAVESVYAATVLGRPMIAAVLLPSIVVFEIAGVYLSDRTLQRWRSWISGEEEALRAASRRPAAAPAMERLLAALSPETICLDLETATKDETFVALVEQAATASVRYFDREEAVQLIREREQLMPTGMGHGIAIPHCRLLALDRPLVVFARHREGVVFGGVDHEPCRLIALILSGAGAPDEHVRLLGAMARLLSSAATRQALLEAPTIEAFHAAIRHAATT